MFMDRPDYEQRPARPLSDAERMDWLRLSRSQNVGPRTFFELLRYFGDAGRALEKLPELARRGGHKKPIAICSAATARRELDRLAAAGGRLLAVIEPDYPEPLAMIHDPPPVLSVKGQAALLAKTTVGIVGARNASANGRRIAATLAAGLGKAGLVVASGLARGIDTAAHASALESGTVAVLAGGVDVCYPRENQALYEDIAARGVLVAEMPVGTEPQGRHFPRRNRIISGLSRGVVVVEAALRSGSLITSRLALEQDREVFAVPGSPLDPRCRGTNNLIREGAVLVEDAEDIVRALLAGGPPAAREQLAIPFEEEPMKEPDEQDLDRARPLVEEALSPTPTIVDEIIRATDLPPKTVLGVLIEIELAGRLDRLPGNRVALSVSPPRPAP